MPPVTRYVDADGARIAFQIFGQGPPTVVVAAGSFSHTDVLWEDPAAALFYARLASFSEVVRYDRLGTANSDPFPPGWDPGATGYLRELEAVLSVVDAESVAILALLDGGPMAIRFAADHPDRVSKLVLYNTTARFLAADDYPIGLAPEAIDALLTMIAQAWGTEAQVAMNVPSKVGDEAFSAWYGKYVRAIGTPTTMADSLRRMLALDVRDALSSVAAPTLVLHRSGYGPMPVAHGRYLADHLEHARLAELPGSDGPAFWETPDLILDHLREFLTEDTTPAPSSSEVATVLFTDIVGSTQRLGELGDRQWAAVLGIHQEVSGRALAEGGGRFVKSTGDGILATFQDPAQAVDCARRLGRSLQEMGITIRAGIHSGRIDRQGSDVGGLAVHIASRVMGAAPDGGVAVSRTVRDLLLGSDHHFESMGFHTLKGVEGDWELYRLV